MLSEYAFKIGRKKGNDFLIIVPLSEFHVTSNLKDPSFQGSNAFLPRQKRFDIQHLQVIHEAFLKDVNHDLGRSSKEKGRSL